MKKKFQVGIAMGSDSDWPLLKDAAQMLSQFGVNFEKRVVSAHRTPEDMANYGKEAQERGLQVIIAAAGGAAHLPGMLAAHSVLPVIGVPVPSKHLQGLDSLLSIVQMPKGIPVATVAIGGAANAALLAIQILALQDKKLSAKLAAFRSSQAKESKAKNKALR